MPFQTSSPPPPVVRTVILTRAGTAWNTTPSSSLFAGNGGPSMGLTGANAGTIGYQAINGQNFGAMQLIPNAGADQAVRLQSTNGAQRYAGLFVQCMQTATNPFPGVRWQIRYRMSVAGVLVPNAAGVDSQLHFGIGSDFGFVFSRPRGPGIWLSVLGDALPNWRVWAIDDNLGGGGAVTVNADTGVALSGDPQTLELRAGNVDGSNFIEARIDGVTVWSPTVPVAAAYPTGETTVDFQAGVLRGADAADTVEFFALDEMSPTAFLEEFP